MRLTIGLAASALTLLMAGTALAQDKAAMPMKDGAAMKDAAMPAKDAMPMKDGAAMKDAAMPAKDAMPMKDGAAMKDAAMPAKDAMKK